MKKMIAGLRLRTSLLVLSVLATIVSFAQETKKVDINIGTKDSGGFFSNTWVWVVGAAVFILLLVALLRGNKSNA